MFRFTGMEKGRGGVFASVFLGAIIGGILDRSDSNKMVYFRDRSRLYGRELKDGERPSWPSQDQYWT